MVTTSTGDYLCSHVTTEVFTCCPWVTTQNLVILTIFLIQWCCSCPILLLLISWKSLIGRFMGPTWGPSGADRTQVGPMLAPWTSLSGMLSTLLALCEGNPPFPGNASHKVSVKHSIGVFLLLLLLLLACKNHCKTSWVAGYSKCHGANVTSL